MKKYWFQNYLDYLNSKEYLWNETEKRLLNRMFSLYISLSKEETTAEYFFYQTREIIIICFELCSLDEIEEHQTKHGMLKWDDKYNACCFFAFLRNYLIHLPIFDNWSEVSISKRNIKYIQTNSEKQGKWWWQSSCISLFKMIKWKTLKFWVIGEDKNAIYTLFEAESMKHYDQWEEVMLKQDFLEYSLPQFMGVIFCVKLYCKYDMKLEFPDTHHEEWYAHLLSDFNKWEDHAPSRLWQADSYTEFLVKIHGDVIYNENWVNSHLFFWVVDNRVVWSIQIRHSIDHPNLIENGWHIGYGIWKSYRRKGYASKMLGLALEESKKIWLQKVLITCNLDNKWSIGVIENNWWVFERLSKDWTKRRYWIIL